MTATERLCAYCSTPCGPRHLNTGNGPHHLDCWIKQTDPTIGRTDD